MSGARDVWRRARAIAVLDGGSGCAGLGYQIVWTQQCSLWLGHEAAAVLAVVTAFFGGLALGGLALGSRIEKSEKPLRWYVGCELAIAFWGVVLVVVGSPFSGFVRGRDGRGAVPALAVVGRVFGDVRLFLPATAAMGATLPAMERLTAQLRSEGRSIAALYASNTFGAVLGVLVVAFWLVPAVGLARSAAVCIALNAACAVVAFARVSEDAPVAASPPANDRARARSVLVRSRTGILGIGYEVVVVRVLEPGDGGHGLHLRDRCSRCTSWAPPRAQGVPALARSAPGSKRPRRPAFGGSFGRLSPRRGSLFAAERVKGCGAGALGPECPRQSPPRRRSRCSLSGCRPSSWARCSVTEPRRERGRRRASAARSASTCWPRQPRRLWASSRFLRSVPRSRCRSSPSATSR